MACPICEDRGLVDCPDCDPTDMQDWDDDADACGVCRTCDNEHEIPCPECGDMVVV